MDEVKIKIQELANKFDELEENEYKLFFIYKMMAFELILEYLVRLGIELGNYDIKNLIINDSKESEKFLYNIYQDLISGKPSCVIPKQAQELIDYLLDLFGK